MACVVRIYWKPLTGNQLWSRAGDTPGERSVVRRRLIAVRGSAVDRVELPDMQTFFEEGDA